MDNIIIFSNIRTKQRKTDTISEIHKLSTSVRTLTLQYRKQQRLEKSYVLDSFKTA